MFSGLSKGLKKILPKRLFYRALLIVAVPVITLQLLITVVFFDSLWIKTNKGMTRTLVNEISAPGMIGAGLGAWGGHKAGLYLRNQKLAAHASHVRGGMLAQHPNAPIPGRISQLTNPDYWNSLSPKEHAVALTDLEHYNTQLQGIPGDWKPVMPQTGSYGTTGAIVGGAGGLVGGEMIDDKLDERDRRKRRR